ncbi:hypothetical protein [Sorangium sp. So ce176]|uniref:hypothetical protein n=1 Tax=Sorangium sp. So ce176 TaxID=3133286 RepID=UPI003F630AC2
MAPASSDGPGGEAEGAFAGRSGASGTGVIGVPAVDRRPSAESPWSGIGVRRAAEPPLCGGSELVWPRGGGLQRGGCELRELSPGGALLRGGCEPPELSPGGALLRGGCEPPELSPGGALLRGGCELDAPRRPLLEGRGAGTVLAGAASGCSSSGVSSSRPSPGRAASSARRSAATSTIRSLASRASACSRTRHSASPSAPASVTRGAAPAPCRRRSSLSLSAGKGCFPESATYRVTPSAQVSSPRDGPSPAARSGER